MRLVVAGHAGVAVLALAVFLFPGGEPVAFAVSLSNRTTAADATGVMTIGTWTAKALEERYAAIGEPTSVLPQADSSQHFLQTVKEHVWYLTPRFVCHTNASGGRFVTYFQTPTAPGGTNYPISFPMWDAASLLDHVGAPTDWFDVTPWRPGISDSNGWLYVSNLLSALRWTCRQDSGQQDGITKYAGGNSCTNTLEGARTIEGADWYSQSYEPGGDCLFAVAVVTASNKCTGNPYYVNGYRAYAKPVLGSIATGMSHRASWYLLFEQGRWPDTDSYDHPYYLRDGVSGLNVHSPHVAYVEELPVSDGSTETGCRPFQSATSSVNPGQYAQLPSAGRVSRVEYVACDTALWLLKWDVAGGFQYR